MRPTWIMVLWFVLMSLSLPTAAQQAVPPSNDDFSAAKPLKLGKPVTVFGVESATWGGTDPDPSCSSDTGYSLWFKVEMTHDAELTIYTHGTALSQLWSSGQPIIDERLTITVYELDFFGELAERACEPSGFNPYIPTTLHGVGVSVGTAYIRVSADPTMELLAPSQVRIQVQPYITDWVKNPAFYDGLTGWKVINGSNDKVVENDPAINNGLPAFKFTGNNGQNAQLKQVIPVDSVNFGSSAVLDVVGVYAHDFSDFEFVMNIVVRYKNGTTQKFIYRDTQTFPDLNPNSGWIAWYPLKNGKIKSVVVSIPFKRTSGTLVLSYVSLGIRATSPARSELLALPQP